MFAGGVVLQEHRGKIVTDEVELKEAEKGDDHSPLPD